MPHMQWLAIYLFREKVGPCVDDMRTIGTRIREIRAWRRKSLIVVAGLAGISAG